MFFFSCWQRRHSLSLSLYFDNNWIVLCVILTRMKKKNIFVVWRADGHFNRIELVRVCVHGSIPLFLCASIIAAAYVGANIKWNAFFHIPLWVCLSSSLRSNLIPLNPRQQQQQKNKPLYAVYIRQWAWWRLDHPNNNSCIELILITINFWNEFDFKPLVRRKRLLFCCCSFQRAHHRLKLPTRLNENVNLSSEIFPT